MVSPKFCSSLKDIRSCNLQGETHQDTFELVYSAAIEKDRFLVSNWIND